MELKMMIAAALAASASAGGLRGRELTTDDIGDDLTCAAALDVIAGILPGEYADAQSFMADERPCVKWPSVYNLDGEAWRSGLKSNGLCFCDNYCDALDDCCVDFCATCAEYPTADEDISVFDNDILSEDLDDWEDAPQIPYPKGAQSSDAPEFFFPQQPLCIAPSAEPSPFFSAPPSAFTPPQEVCTLEIPYATFDELFPWIQYDDSVALGRFDGGDFSDDGRPLQWLMSVDKISDTEVLQWADSDLSILPPVGCDGQPLVSGFNTETDDRYVFSTDPCDWIPYIANGWDQLPKCVVDPHLDRHRANARHLKAIDMAMQRRQDCCRDCSPLNAVQYARTTVVLDSEAYPEGVETTVYFVGNDGAAFWVNGFRAYDENICSAAITGFLKPVAVFLQPGDNVFTVKARNHGIMMKELNHGFIMRFDTELIPNLTLSLAKPTAPPVPDFNFP
mmetsp:Transcript_36111/g.113389  ORF Transcript_36111/g.113389 Transcript_36111/m.113389 type:complete len:450 (-) Transcript_36111:140-1489(-)